MDLVSRLRDFGSFAPEFEVIEEAADALEALLGAVEPFVRISTSDARNDYEPLVATIRFYGFNNEMRDLTVGDFRRLAQAVQSIRRGGE